ncbi:YaiI/YqxD family protein [Bacillus haikouensis]|uniref:YaiI/YqxD family protein n=1 Tax=Bacillus haikouensis TaxID=1510468 RepID=UPI0015517D71|nr:YaiI/YqxD family protein [Bacillus haikouensis]NQD66242.1 YaiI/YqxD family protein [Bacillus haikouensis]
MVSNSKQKSTVFVDADACPVKPEIIRISEDYGFEVVFVASHAHQKNTPDEGRWVYVDSEKEAADLYIMNHVRMNDILVTQDIGLASLVLPKKVYALSPRGKVYREESIVTALDYRYVAAKERRKGNYGKGPKSFTNNDRKEFSSQFERILSKIAGK